MPIPTGKFSLKSVACSMFRTELAINPSNQSIQLQQKILTLGSCFSDAVGEKLRGNKFDTFVNPFGVSYNPLSIHKLIRLALYNEVPSPQNYISINDIHAHYDFHSEFSSLQKPALEQKLKGSIGATHYFLKETKWIIITYGTSWVYERNDTGEIVSNCHKVPTSKFTKSLLSQKRILEDFALLHQELTSFNNEAQIILTVSPVRHIKDTLPLNSVSKSILRLTCHTLQEAYPNVHYFPSYEIMLDDLRDYRFYKADLIHPNEQAEEYIWRKFIEACFDKSTLEFLTKWESIQSALSHKPFHPQSTQHQKFLVETLRKVESLKPIINVEEEIRVIKSQLL